jgi:acylphosphatase
MGTEPVRVHARITGLVQGVCYRWYTQETASQLSVAGWVRNLPDGSVELVAEGDKDQLEQLLDWCRQGPSMARVSNVDAKWSQATGEFTGFSIQR